MFFIIFHCVLGELECCAVRELNQVRCCILECFQTERRLHTLNIRDMECFPRFEHRPSGTHDVHVSISTWRHQFLWLSRWNLSRQLTLLLLHSALLFLLCFVLFCSAFSHCSSFLHLLLLCSISWFFILFSFFCSSPVLCSSCPLLPLFDDSLPMDVEQLFSERGLNSSKFVDLTRTELQDFEGNLIAPRIHAPSDVDTSHTFKSQRLPGRRKNRSQLGVKCLVLSKVCRFGSCFSNFGWCFFQDSSSMLFVLDLFNAFNLWICKSWSQTIWIRSRSNHHRLEEQHNKIWGNCMNLLSDYASLWFSIWGGHNPDL